MKMSGFFRLIEAPLKFVQVQRQIFLADVVIGADDSALEQRPERINALSVNLARAYSGSPSREDRKRG